MADRLKILCVHGAGRHPKGGDWEDSWKDSIVGALNVFKDQYPNIEPVIRFVDLDQVFENFLGEDNLSLEDVINAGMTAGSSAINSFFRQPRVFSKRPRSMQDGLEALADMVIKWVADEDMRREAMKKLREDVKSFNPHIVCAHSLGSLVSYDLFTGNGSGDQDDKKLIGGRFFISCGSQIGHPTVRDIFGGYITELKEAKYWYHLFNENDIMLTAKIQITDPEQDNFKQIETPFNIPEIYFEAGQIKFNIINGVANHDVTNYMSDQNAKVVWSNILKEFSEVARGSERSLINPETSLASTSSSNSKKPTSSTKRKTQKRALLVGINEYPNPQNNLEGCVNDVFLMSELLQESGFEAEDIRVVLNDRATCAAVRERLEWLLDDAGKDDIRVFYYSGHGAQIPSYGFGDKIDRLDETLVLYDFDWTRERAFTDDYFYSLYSQLPYDLQFYTIFDCCHSGGMTRAATHKVRGIDPPDDIRHRLLKWDDKNKMWVERDLTFPNAVFDKYFNPSEKTSNVHIQRPTHRLGQAMDLRGAPGTPKMNQQTLDSMGKEEFQLLKDEMKQRASARGHNGPYLPVLIYACREEESSFEYRHGAISYGAFTYSFVKTFREHSKGTLQETINKVGKTLKNLHYDQQPKLVAPTRFKGGSFDSKSMKIASKEISENSA